MNIDQNDFVQAPTRQLSSSPSIVVHSTTAEKHAKEKCHENLKGLDSGSNSNAVKVDEVSIE